MAYTTQTEVEDLSGMTLRVKAIEITDKTASNGDLSVSGDLTAGTLTVTGAAVLNGTITLDIADIPAYADQAAAAAALAPGQLFRFNTTGALGVALT